MLILIQELMVLEPVPEIWVENDETMSLDPSKIKDPPFALL
jgi:hypothetical protein